MDAPDQPDAALDPTAALRRGDRRRRAELHAGVPAAALERPPRPEFGDYSTNAAMLAAPLIGSPPREVAATLATGVEERLGDALERVEVAGPGFLNLHMSEAWMRTPPPSTSAAAGEASAPASAARPDLGPGRVRQRQPDRPADRRQRAAPRLRRLARPGARVRRPPGRPRVLPERRRRADRAVRRLDRRPDRGRRRCPRAATRATTWPSSASGSSPRAAAELERRGARASAASS